MNISASLILSTYTKASNCKMAIFELTNITFHQPFHSSLFAVLYPSGITGELGCMYMAGKFLYEQQVSIALNSDEYQYSGIQCQNSFQTSPASISISFCDFRLFLIIYRLNDISTIVEICSCQMHRKLVIT